ncbi:flavoprotein [Multifurca ochricompacta]|uniref:Flavoprotein n=1 Tax=Multifurca ochricompacta TaxID=376703 RepID=A0AAD4QLD5_9AGAM|nr:flavoprotein [Multifurca ochricompacta]
MTTRHFTAAVNRLEGHTHVLLITTGSVASIKAPLIVEELLKYKNVSVTVAATKPSLTFFRLEDIRRQGVDVWTDDDEWDPSYRIGDPILHIELRRWADIVLISPCSANTLAKIANGICDNLVTSLLRALAPTTPTYVYPAMNTLMYEHPLTAHHIRTIREVIGYNVVGPVSKGLACGDVGVGAMVDWRDIVASVVERFLLIKDLDTDNNVN